MLAALTAVVALLGSVLVAAPAAAVVPAPADAVAAPAAAAAMAGAPTDAGVRDAGIVKAAAVSGFDPESIISDSLFYDANAMSAAEIQSFLDSKIGTCENGKCLNVLQTAISSRDAWVSQATGQLVCSAIRGGTMPVSELIYRVQVACGISAKVILVTLQKEQGLTTSSAPSDWNLRAAMGASCPDTEPCDPSFAGVGPQIVKGVQQLKIYKAGRFGKQPGANYIGYNPNGACGGTTLNIRNYATAALYNYTPYQPNPAALAAGWGLGDGCSSYGNRNFYNYYTSWFGSVSVTNGGLYSVGPDIYLVTGGARYHVTAADWPAYQRAFGTPSGVSASMLQSVTSDGGQATRYLLNPATSVVAYLDGGTLHRFSSCELVAAWGGSCGNGLTTVGAEVFTRLGTGPEMTQYARLAERGLIHRIAGGSLIPYANAAALKADTGARSPYAAVMSAAAVSSYSIARIRFAPAALVRASNDSRVYLPVGGGRLLYVPAFGLVDDLGLSRSVTVVPAASLASWSESGTLSPVVSCGGKAYFAASGTLHRLVDGTKLPLSDLGSAVCDTLRLAKDAPAKAFVQVPGQAEIYLLQNGQSRHVTSFAKLIQLAGTSTPRVMSVSADTLGLFPAGPSILDVAAGGLVRAAGDARVYLPVDGGRLLYVPAFGLITDLGLSTSVTVAPAGSLSSWSQAGTLSPVVSCGGKAYFAASGTLHRLVDGTKLPLSDVGSAVCGTLRLAKDAPAKAFVQVPGQAEIYLLQNGQSRHITSVAKLVELAGTSTPRVMQVTSETLGLFSAGPAIFDVAPGALVRAEGDTRVYLPVDGGRLLYVPAFGLITDLGMSTAVTDVAPESLSSWSQSGTLSPVVSCGGTSYLAASGTLVPVSAEAGVRASDLGTSVCRTLTRESGESARTFVRAAGQDKVYLLQDGRARHITSMEKLIEVARTKTPRVLTVTQDSLALVPAGKVVR